MERFIKYKRIEVQLMEYDIQIYLDNMIADGWEIIYYHEKPRGFKLHIIMIVGKKQTS